MKLFLLTVTFLGLCLLIHWMWKCFAVLAILEDHPLSSPENKELKKNTTILNWLRSAEYLISSCLSFFIVVIPIVILTGTTLGAFKWVIIAVFMISTIYNVVYLYFIKMKGLEKQYNDIVDQWAKEKKVSEIHDDEVRYVRAYRSMTAKPEIYMIVIVTFLAFLA